MSNLGQLFTLPLLLCESALTAASSGSATQTGNPTPSFGVVVAIICYMRRKKPIGGWLLYFFWSVYGGGVITAIFVAAGIKNYLPASWDDRFLYALFLASTVPAVAIVVCLIAAATVLLRRRNWQWVIRIRWILAADILAGIVAVLIDSKFFPDNLFFDVYGLIFPSIFLPYMFRSDRVRRVFLSNDWDEEIKPASFTDSKPQRGITYTESELESMRERESLTSVEEEMTDGKKESTDQAPAPKVIEQEANANASVPFSVPAATDAGRRHWQAILSVLRTSRTYVLGL